MRRILFFCFLTVFWGCSSPEEDEFREQEDGTLVLTATGRQHGWIPLFNGRDLSGWQPGGSTDLDDYRVVDGVLEFPKEGGDGHLRTAGDYRDFELTLDFQLAFMANSGVFMRAERSEANPAYSGCEVQLLDDFNWERVTGSTLRPDQFTGSLYGSVPAGESGLRPLGEWNRYRIVYQGKRLAVSLNGRLLYDVDTTSVPGDPPFSERARAGFIGLQRHAPAQVVDEVYARFRNIFLRPL